MTCNKKCTKGSRFTNELDKYTPWKKCSELTTSLPSLPSCSSAISRLKANVAIAAARHSRVDSVQIWAQGRCLTKVLTYLDTVNARCLIWKPTFPGRNVGPTLWHESTRNQPSNFLVKPGPLVKILKFKSKLLIFPPSQLELLP